MMLSVRQEKKISEIYNFFRSFCSYHPVKIGPLQENEKLHNFRRKHIRLQTKVNGQLEELRAKMTAPVVMVKPLYNSKFLSIGSFIFIH